jgi:hypothetical protein
MTLAVYEPMRNIVNRGYSLYMFTGYESYRLPLGEHKLSTDGSIWPDNTHNFNQQWPLYNPWTQTQQIRPGSPSSADKARGLYPKYTVEMIAGIQEATVLLDSRTENLFIFRQGKWEYGHIIRDRQWILLTATCSLAAFRCHSLAAFRCLPSCACVSVSVLDGLCGVLICDAAHCPSAGRADGWGE